MYQALAPLPDVHLLNPHKDSIPIVQMRKARQASGLACFLLLNVKYPKLVTYKEKWLMQFTALEGQRHGQPLGRNYGPQECKG
jgi:hypothetical protein